MIDYPNLRSQTNVPVCNWNVLNGEVSATFLKD